MAFGKKKKGKSEQEAQDLSEEILQAEQEEASADMTIIEDLENPDGTRGKKKKEKRHIGIGEWFCRFLAFVAVLASLYCTAVFSNIPFIKYWRDIYIETAMSTMTHQWLATAFIPGWIIDDVMDNVHAGLNQQENLESNWTTVWEEEEEEATEAEQTVEVSGLDAEAFYSKYWELDSDSVRAYLNLNPDLLADGYENLVIEDLKGKLALYASTGDQVLVIDCPNNVIIVKIAEGSYQGKLAICKNADQVDLAQAKNYGTRGETALSYAERLNAVITVNASRFKDIGGHGNGSTIKGSYVINGEEIGNPVGTKESGWKFCGFKEDKKFYIGNLASIDKSEYIWGMECVPALIVNGEKVVDGSFGMGIQPRTSVGQCANGDFMFLVIDGRNPGWSIGCTVDDCAEIMLRYHCYQAMNMDGGSSSVMYYKTKQITKCSSASGEGRYTPNAFVFLSADGSETEETVEE